MLARLPHHVEDAPDEGERDLLVEEEVAQGVDEDPSWPLPAQRLLLLLRDQAEGLLAECGAPDTVACAS